MLRFFFAQYTAMRPVVSNARCYIQRVIQSAVIPVAGHGTRLLPATKSQPKEMLPVARKPIVQYVVEELVSNGIRQILFVTGRSKASIENHFDHDPELFRALRDGHKDELLREIDFEALKANFFYTRQPLQRGLGDAVLCGESFAGEEPFLVALGDSILGLNAVSRAVSRMAEVYESSRASCVIAVEEVPHEETRHYGIVQPEESGDVFRIVNLVEKPRPENAPSNLAIAGRYIFSPVIFDMIRRVEPDSRGEIQLTNAIQLLCEQGQRVVGVKLARGEKRYDIGNFPSYFESFVEFALADPVYGHEFRRVLERLLAESRVAAAKA
jgi:UTP--glucose-1-phosphate uridylyltransferase